MTTVSCRLCLFEFSLVTTKTQAIEYDDGKHVHCYTWSNGLPFSSMRQVMVNLVKYEMKRMVRPDTFEIVYKNAWITNHQITADNVAEIVLGGRARWKIENECFNTLKNQGYNLEHSYGHGENNLSFNFAILTTLAFFMHQILEFKDELFQALRKKCGSKMNLWNKLRTYIENLIFESFEVLMGYILDRRPYIGDRLLTPADYGTIIRAGPMIVG